MPPPDPWTEFAQTLREGMVKSGIFKDDLVSTAIEKLKARFNHIDNLTFMGALQNGQTLTLAEKRKLGLSSRKKYDAGFLAFIDFKNLKGRDPRDVYGAVFSAAWFLTKRRMDLARIRMNGLFKAVDILILDDCSVVKNAPKKYAIADVPDLPLPGCTVECCRCIYIVGEMIDFE